MMLESSEGKDSPLANLPVQSKQRQAGIRRSPHHLLLLLLVAVAICANFISWNHRTDATNSFHVGNLLQKSVVAKKKTTGRRSSHWTGSIVSTPFKIVAGLGNVAGSLLFRKKTPRIRKGTWVIAWVPLSKDESDIESCEVCQVTELVDGGLQLTRLDGTRLLLPPYAVAPASEDLSIAAQMNWAAKRGDIGSVEQCLRAGVPTDAKSTYHGTPLHLAAEGGYVAIIRLLLSYGANPNALDGTRSSPLHLAACYGNTEAISLLVHSGAKIDSIEPGWTPLHGATNNRHLAAVSRLVGLGASLELPTLRNESALEIAKRIRDADIQNLLIQIMDNSPNSSSSTTTTGINAADAGTTTTTTTTTTGIGGKEDKAVGLLIESTPKIEEATPSYTTTTTNDTIADEHPTVVVQHDDYSMEESNKHQNNEYDVVSTDNFEQEIDRVVQKEEEKEEEEEVNEEGKYDAENIDDQDEYIEVNTVQLDEEEAVANDRNEQQLEISNLKERRKEECYSSSSSFPSHSSSLGGKELVEDYDAKQQQQHQNTLIHTKVNLKSKTNIKKNKKSLRRSSVGQLPVSSSSPSPSSSSSSSSSSSTLSSSPSPNATTTTTTTRTSNFTTGGTAAHDDDHVEIACASPTMKAAAKYYTKEEGEEEKEEEGDTQREGGGGGGDIYDEGEDKRSWIQQQQHNDEGEDKRTWIQQQQHNDFRQVASSSSSSSSSSSLLSSAIAAAEATTTTTAVGTVPDSTTSSTSNSAVSFFSSCCRKLLFPMIGKEEVEVEVEEECEDGSTATTSSPSTTTTTTTTTTATTKGMFKTKSEEIPTITTTTTTTTTKAAMMKKPLLASTSSATTMVRNKGGGQLKTMMKDSSTINSATTATTVVGLGGDEEDNRAFVHGTPLYKKYVRRRRRTATSKDDDDDDDDKYEGESYYDLGDIHYDEVVLTGQDNMVLNSKLLMRYWNQWYLQNKTRLLSWETRAPANLTNEEMDRLTKQLEFYFSAQNLYLDVYMLENMDAEGWFPIRLLHNFQRVARFKANSKQLLEAISRSDDLVVTEDLKFIRRFSPLNKTHLHLRLARPIPDEEKDFSNKPGGSSSGISGAIAEKGITTMEGGGRFTRKSHTDDCEEGRTAENEKNKEVEEDDEEDDEESLYIREMVDAEEFVPTAHGIPSLFLQNLPSNIRERSVAAGLLTMSPKFFKRINITSLPFGLKFNEGTKVIREVRQGSHADKAGLRPGWVLHAVNDNEVFNFNWEWEYDNAALAHSIDTSRESRCPFSLTFRMPDVGNEFEYERRVDPEEQRPMILNEFIKKYKETSTWEKSDHYDFVRVVDMRQYLKDYYHTDVEAINISKRLYGLNDDRGEEEQVVEKLPGISSPPPKEHFLRPTAQYEYVQMEEDGLPTQFSRFESEADKDRWEERQRFIKMMERGHSSSPNLQLNAPMQVGEIVDPEDLELRIDPTDGKPKNQFQFYDKYKGSHEWRSADVHREYEEGRGDRERAAILTNAAVAAAAAAKTAPDSEDDGDHKPGPSIMHASFHGEMCNKIKEKEEKEGTNVGSIAAAINYYDENNNNNVKIAKSAGTAEEEQGLLWMGPGIGEKELLPEHKHLMKQLERKVVISEYPKEAGGDTRLLPTMMVFSQGENHNDDNQENDGYVAAAAASDYYNGRGEVVDRGGRRRDDTGRNDGNEYVRTTMKKEGRCIQREDEQNLKQYSGAGTKKKIPPLPLPTLQRQVAQRQWKDDDDDDWEHHHHGPMLAANKGKQHHQFLTRQDISTTSNKYIKSRQQQGDDDDDDARFFQKLAMHAKQDLTASTAASADNWESLQEGLVNFLGFKPDFFDDINVSLGVKSRRNRSSSSTRQEEEEEGKEEYRYDPVRDGIFSKREFKLYYGCLVEWESALDARELPRKKAKQLAKNLVLEHQRNNLILKTYNKMAKLSGEGNTTDFNNLTEANLFFKKQSLEYNQVALKSFSFLPKSLQKKHMDDVSNFKRGVRKVADLASKNDMSAATRAAIESIYQIRNAQFQNMQTLEKLKHAFTRALHGVSNSLERISKPILDDDDKGTRIGGGGGGEGTKEQASLLLTDTRKILNFEEVRLIAYENQILVDLSSSISSKKSNPNNNNNNDDQDDYVGGGAKIEEDNRKDQDEDVRYQIRLLNLTSGDELAFADCHVVGAAASYPLNEEPKNHHHHLDSSSSNRGSGCSSTSSSSVHTKGMKVFQVTDLYIFPILHEDESVPEEEAVVWEFKIKLLTSALINILANQRNCSRSRILVPLPITNTTTTTNTAIIGSSVHDAVASTPFPPPLIENIHGGQQQEDEAEFIFEQRRRECESLGYIEQKQFNDDYYCYYEAVVDPLLQLLMPKLLRLSAFSNIQEEAAFQAPTPPQEPVQPKSHTKITSTSAGGLPGLSSSAFSSLGSPWDMLNSLKNEVNNSLNLDNNHGGTIIDNKELEFQPEKLQGMMTTMMDKLHSFEPMMKMASKLLGGGIGGRNEDTNATASTSLQPSSSPIVSEQQDHPNSMKSAFESMMGMIGNLSPPRLFQSTQYDDDDDDEKEEEKEEMVQQEKAEYIEGGLGNRDHTTTLDEVLNDTEGYKSQQQQQQQLYGHHHDQEALYRADFPPLTTLEKKETEFPLFATEKKETVEETKTEVYNDYGDLEYEEDVVREKTEFFNENGDKISEQYHEKTKNKNDEQEADNQQRDADVDVNAKYEDFDQDSADHAIIPKKMEEEEELKSAYYDEDGDLLYNEDELYLRNNDDKDTGGSGAIGKDTVYEEQSRTRAASPLHDNNVLKVTTTTNNNYESPWRHDDTAVAKEMNNEFAYEEQEEEEEEKEEEEESVPAREAKDSALRDDADQQFVLAQAEGGFAEEERETQRQTTVDYSSAVVAPMEEEKDDKTSTRKYEHSPLSTKPVDDGKPIPRRDRHRPDDHKLRSTQNDDIRALISEAKFVLKDMDEKYHHLQLTTTSSSPKLLAPAIKAHDLQTEERRPFLSYSSSTTITGAPAGSTSIKKRMASNTNILGRLNDNDDMSAAIVAASKDIGKLDLTMQRKGKGEGEEDIDEDHDDDPRDFVDPRDYQLLSNLLGKIKQNRQILEKLRAETPLPGEVQSLPKLPETFSDLMMTASSPTGRQALPILPSPPPLSSSLAAATREQQQQQQQQRFLSNHHHHHQQQQHQQMLNFAAQQQQQQQQQLMARSGGDPSPSHQYTSYYNPYTNSMLLTPPSSPPPPPPQYPTLQQHHPSPQAAAASPSSPSSLYGYNSEYATVGGNPSYFYAPVSSSPPPPPPPPPPYSFPTGTAATVPTSPSPPISQYYYGVGRGGVGRGDGGGYPHNYHPVVAGRLSSQQLQAQHAAALPPYLSHHPYYNHLLHSQQQQQQQRSRRQSNYDYNTNDDADDDDDSFSSPSSSSSSPMRAHQQHDKAATTTFSSSKRRSLAPTNYDPPPSHHIHSSHSPPPSSLQTLISMSQPQSNKDTTTATTTTTTLPNSSSSRSYLKPSTEDRQNHNTQLKHHQQKQMMGMTREAVAASVSPSYIPPSYNGISNAAEGAATGDADDEKDEDYFNAAGNTINSDVIDPPPRNDYDKRARRLGRVRRNFDSPLRSKHPPPPPPPPPPRGYNDDETDTSRTTAAAHTLDKYFRKQQQQLSRNRRLLHSPDHHDRAAGGSSGSSRRAPIIEQEKHQRQQLSLQEESAKHQHIYQQYYQQQQQHLRNPHQSSSLGQHLTPPPGDNAITSHRRSPSSSIGRRKNKHQARSVGNEYQHHPAYNNNINAQRQKEEYTAVKQYQQQQAAAAAQGGGGGGGGRGGRGGGGGGRAMATTLPQYQHNTVNMAMHNGRRILPSGVDGSIDPMNLLTDSIPPSPRSE